MLSLNIHNLLTDRGIERHNLFLHKLGMSRPTATNILNSDFTFINITHLSKICEALNCTPSDVFIWNDNPNNPLPEGHSLQKLKKKNTPPINTRIRSLNSEQLDKLNSFLEEIEKK